MTHGVSPLWLMGGFMLALQATAIVLPTRLNARRFTGMGMAFQPRATPTDAVSRSASEALHEKHQLPTNVSIRKRRSAKDVIHPALLRIEGMGVRPSNVECGDGHGGINHLLCHALPSEACSWNQFQ